MVSCETNLGLESIKLVLYAHTQSDRKIRLCVRLDTHVSGNVIKNLLEYIDQISTSH